MYSRKVLPIQTKGLKDGIEAEIKKAKGIDDYSKSKESQKYKEILDVTTRKMIFMSDIN